MDQSAALAFDEALHARQLAHPMLADIEPAVWIGHARHRIALLDARHYAEDTHAQVDGAERKRYPNCRADGCLDGDRQVHHLGDA